MLKEYFQLGIVFKDDKPISHRSLLKIFINPILRRLFKRALGSNIENNKFVSYSFIKQTEPKNFNFKINFDYDYII